MAGNNQTPRSHIYQATPLASLDSETPKPSPNPYPKRKPVPKFIANWLALYITQKNVGAEGDFITNSNSSSSALTLKGNNSAHGASAASAVFDSGLMLECMRRLSLALPKDETVSAKSKEQITGSTEQQAIWDAMADSENRDHLLVNAVAGSGKSTTCIEGAKRVKASEFGHRVNTIVYLAFNKHVQAEMHNRAEGAVEARTFHSLGLAACSAAFGAVKIDERRMWAVIGAMRKWEKKEYPIQQGLKRLCAAAKQCDVDTEAELQRLVDWHGIDLGEEADERRVVEMCPSVLARASEFSPSQIAVIDYDDMCWLPKKLSMRIRPAELGLIDEAQDLNPVQQWLALRSAERLMIVGDRRQAIYNWRGADANAMHNLAAMASGEGKRGVASFPLSFTRRCPHSHVRLAQCVVPGIHALPTARDGVVRLVDAKAMVSDSAAGDMIVCRTNAPLIDAAHKLLAMGKRAVIRGKDVGAGILRLLDQAEAKSAGGTLGGVLAFAQMLTDMDVTRFYSMRERRGEMRAASAEDRLQCLLSAAEGCGSVSELRNKLTLLFSDDDAKSNAITLSTVHKAKGLQARRVIVLKPELLPHPRAVKPHEIEQEMNCLYVALTRAKEELWFVDALPNPLNSMLSTLS